MNKLVKCNYACAYSNKENAYFLSFRRNRRQIHFQFGTMYSREQNASEKEEENSSMVNGLGSEQLFERYIWFTFYMKFSPIISNASRKTGAARISNEKSIYPFIRRTKISDYSIRMLVHKECYELPYSMFNSIKSHCSHGMNSVHIQYNVTTLIYKLSTLPIFFSLFLLNCTIKHCKSNRVRKSCYLSACGRPQIGH